MVKKTFTGVLLILYVSLVLRTFLPVLYYAVNYNYIVTHLCVERDKPENLCMGSCFLSESIKKQFEESQKKHSTTIITFANLFIPHLSFSSETEYSEPVTQVKYFICEKQLIKQFVEPATPPPQFLLSV